MDSMPTELDQITRRALQLEIEAQALAKETDKGSRERLEQLHKELADLKERGDSMRAQWQGEKDALKKAQTIREEIETVRRDLEVAERNYDLNRAAELRHGRLPILEKQLETEEALIAKNLGGTRLLREQETEDEIATIVSKWTGIPLTRLIEGEREKLLHLEEELHRRVIGQDEAVQAVTDSIIRARAGIKDPNRPIGSFIFLGPTGVGKTELARALAETLFDTEDNIVRIDLSEYQEKHSISRLIGAPPGYVGYDEGGQLTEAVRRKPYCVILFDEFEKAHRDVSNVMLQILDDGRLTDSQGRTVDFKNTVIIMTSNIGSQHLISGVENGEITEYAKARVTEELEAVTRPEFLNRIDDIVMFSPLRLDEIERIVDIQVGLLRGRLRERSIELDLTEAARVHLAKTGYDPVYGARPLKRLIQRQLETRIGRALIAGSIEDGTVLTVDVKDGEIVVEPASQHATA